MSTRTNFLELTMDYKDDRYNVDRVNKNTQEIDKQFQRMKLVKNCTGSSVSVSDAVGPNFKITNNSAITATVTFTAPTSFEDELEEGMTATYDISAANVVNIAFTSNVEVRLEYNAHLQTWLQSLANRSATLDRITALEERVAELEGGA